jgi:hypothetical protein
VLGRWEFTAPLGSVVPKGGVGITPVCSENTFNTNPQSCLYSAFVPFKNFKGLDGSAAPSPRQLTLLGSVGLQVSDALSGTSNPTGPFRLFVHSFSAVYPMELG